MLYGLLGLISGTVLFAVLFFAVYVALPPRNVVQLINLWAWVRLRKDVLTPLAGRQSRLLWDYLTALRGPDVDALYASSLKSLTTAYLRWPLRFLCKGYAQNYDSVALQSSFARVEARRVLHLASNDDNASHFAGHTLTAFNTLARMGFKDFKNLNL